MDIDYRIDKPILNRPTPEENIAVIDRWIADTADKINFLLYEISKERKDGNDKPD